MDAINTSEIITQAPQKNPFPSLDNSRPKNVVPTSFVAETEEVQTYLKRLGRGEPTAIYEFVQNQWDYNEDVSGPPLIYVITNSGECISYPQLILMNKTNFSHIRDSSRKIEFINNIKDEDGAYFEPEAVVHTRHGGSSGTLGQHGRGGKAASAALVVGDHASSIEYLSRDQAGPWHGQAAMLVDKERFPDQKTPAYTLGYQRFQSPDRVDQTILTVHDPSKILVDSLLELPDYFLPANPNYSGYRFNEIKEKIQQPNLFTAWAHSPENSPINSTSFSSGERNLLNLDPNQEYRESPRVEILSDSVVKKHGYEEGQTDRIFVDGLSMKIFEHYALNWSFWGCGDGQYGYQAQRSTDSDYIRGNYNKLMARVLGKCTNPEVFTSLFENSLNDKECAEGKNLPEEEFIDEISRNPQAKTAMTEAWKNLCQSHELSDQVFVTASEDSLSKAKRKGIQAVKINSPLFVKALHKFDIVKELEQAVDLPKDPASTGEKDKRFRLQETFAERKLAIYHALKDIARHKGKIVLSPQGEIIISFDEIPPSWTDSFKTLPIHVNFLCQDCADYFGSQSQARLVIDRGKGKATQIDLIVKEEYWEKGFISVENFQQPVGSKGKKGMTVTLGHKERLENKDYAAFYSDFQKLFQSLTSDGQTIDPEKLAKTLSPDDFFEDALLEKSQELAVVKGELARLKLEASRELQTVQAQLEDAKRQLGLAEEDAGVISPTRLGIHPDFESDWEPPKDFKRNYMTLFGPNSTLVTSNGGRFLKRAEDMSSPRLHQVPKINSFDDLHSYLQEKRDLLVQPDIKMLNSQLLPAQIQDTLICSHNRELSGDFSFQLIEVECRRSATKPGILMNKSIIAKATAIPCPPNCRVVGFYHPEKNIASQIKINYSPKRGFYNFESQREVTPGLEFYYEYDGNLKNTGQPTPTERQPLADQKYLNPQWRELVQTVKAHQPPLTEKQKLDVALTSWLHAFRYDKDPRIDLQYKDLRPEERAALIVTNARGNCGYCSEGFTILCRLLDLPSTDLAGYLGKRGRFFPGPQNHGLTGVFINNEWVVIEPQLTYLSPGYKREAIPNNFAKLIEKIPFGENIYPLIEQSEQEIGVDEMVARLKKLHVVMDSESLSLLNEILGIQETDDQNIRYYESDEPPIPGVKPKKTSPQPLSATNLRQLIVRHSQAKAEALVELSEEPPFEFDLRNTPEFNIGFDLLTMASEAGMSITPHTTPDQVIKFLLNQTTVQGKLSTKIGNRIINSAKKKGIEVTTETRPLEALLAMTGTQLGEIIGGIYEKRRIILPVTAAVFGLEAIEVADMITQVFQINAGLPYTGFIKPTLEFLAQQAVNLVNKVDLNTIDPKTLKTITGIMLTGGGLGGTGLLINKINLREIMRKLRHRSVENKFYSRKL